MTNKWAGPFRLRDLLDQVHEGSVPRAPEKGSAYLVSGTNWKGVPTEQCDPLYVGGITGGSPRFRTRIGDLVADMFGFFGTGKSNGHHSGGKSLYKWCIQNQINPMDLYLGWVEQTKCHRCLEVALVCEMKPLLNRNTPPRCTLHKIVREK
jgi:hypothetical protein